MAKISLLRRRNIMRIKKPRRDDQDGDANRIQKEQESSPNDQEIEEEKESAEEEEEEQEMDVEEETDEEEEEDKSHLSAIITDSEVLDCDICLDPLTIPVFQCESGHVVCSSCCTSCGKKCPFCSSAVGIIRCRAIEKVLESVKIVCKGYGCDQTLTYRNKKYHESSCPYIGEKEEEEEEDQEMKEEEELDGEEEELDGEDEEAKSISVIFSDPEVLDCSICCEPLTIPVFQCKSGFIACSSCCTGSLSIGYNRCRAIEKVLESVKIPCKHKRYGCDQIVTYSIKKHHESNCPYIPCSCPKFYCRFVSSYENLYSHFNLKHSAMTFGYGESFTVRLKHQYLVLKEFSESLLFVLSSSEATLGQAIWISCISPQTSSKEIHYEVSAKWEDRFLKLESVVNFTQQGFHRRPTTGVLFFPSFSYGLTSSPGLFFNLCIHKPM